MTMSTQNISVYYGLDGRVRLQVEPSPKPILNVNGVRLSGRALDALKSEIENVSAKPYDEYLVENAEHLKEPLLALRNKENIVFENNITVTVPHGNARSIAANGENAYIVSVKNQNQSSADFFKNASGEELREFFNAAAKALEIESMSLKRAFAVIHIRGDNDQYTNSPQKYAHIHLTDANNLNPTITNARTWVKRPDRFPLDSNMLAIFPGRRGEFNIHALKANPESKLHRIIYTPDMSIPDLMKHGTSNMWSAWRDSLFADETIVRSIEEGGVRLVIERGIMHIHGGEPLYQDQSAKRWSALPKPQAPQ